MRSYYLNIKLMDLLELIIDWTTIRVYDINDKEIPFEYWDVNAKVLKINADYREVGELIIIKTTQEQKFFKRSRRFE